MVREERMREILASSAELREAADRLVREANEMGGRDNITVVCFRLGGAPTGAEPDDTGDLGDTMVGVSTADLAAQDNAEAEAEVEQRAPVAAAPRPRRRDPARRRRRLIGTAVALIVVAVLAAGAIGARAALRNIYFVGQDHGLVTLYRGVPYELPGGINLYDTRYVSSVPVARLTPVERRRLLDHKLRSRDDASDLVRQLERRSSP
jgi:protein phosphatase